MDSMEELKKNKLSHILAVTGWSVKVRLVPKNLTEATVIPDFRNTVTDQHFPNIHIGYTNDMYI